MLTVVIFSSKFLTRSLKTMKCVFRGGYNHKYNITIIYIIHRPNESRNKFGKIYRLSQIKPIEHPFRILAPEICPATQLWSLEMVIPSRPAPQDKEFLHKLSGSPSPRWRWAHPKTDSSRQLAEIAEQILTPK